MNASLIFRQLAETKTFRSASIRFILKKKLMGMKVNAIGILKRTKLVNTRNRSPAQLLSCDKPTGYQLLWGF